MRRLRNLTLHEQGERECAVAAQCGFDLCRQPEGVEFGPGANDLADAASMLATRIAECAAAGDAVLLGGHTALWIVALDLLVQRKIRRPLLCYFSTLRKRDAQGRFVFEPVRVECIPADDSEHWGSGGRASKEN